MRFDFEGFLKEGSKMKICSNKDIKLITAGLTAAMLLGGCSQVNNGGRSRSDDDEKPTTISTVELKDDPSIKAAFDLDEVDDTDYDKELMDAAYRSYCFNLFSQTIKNYSGDGNVMISPASIMIALDMVAAGAKDESLQQLTDLFAAGQGPLTQQAYAVDLMKKINDAEEVEFSCANAVWANAKRLSETINMEYVEYIEDKFCAEYTMTEFTDKTTDEINGWIDEHTNHMIEKVINDLDPDAVMVLVNAIAFEGEWMDPYIEEQIWEDTFRCADGSTKEVPFLHDTIGVYFETEEATGFIRSYEGGQYAFIAILPTDESISANEFAMNFTAEDYEAFIASKSIGEYEVITQMPEFESDFEILMNDTISDLGCPSIFSSSTADFSGIAENPGDIYISRIIHKTNIAVDRAGTRAAAATVIEATEACCEEPITPEYRYVICDRPFVYAIVDCATLSPIFIGTVNEV